MVDDTDLKRRLGDPWLRKGFLFVPPTVAQRHGEMENLKAYLTYSELFGATPTMEQFTEKLKDIGLKSLMASLSNLCCVIQNDGVASLLLQRTLRDETLTQDMLARLRKLQNWDERIIFFPQQILLTMKVALLHSPDKEDERSVNEFRDALVETLLIASDLLDQFLTQEDRRELEKELISHLVRNFLMNATDQLRYMIPRTSLLFLKIPFEDELRASPDFIDLPGIFKEATGFELRDYMSLGFAVLYWFLEQSRIRGTYQPDHQSINPTTFFSKTTIDPSVPLKMLEGLTHTYNSARAASKARKQGGVGFTYDFLPFMTRPLYRVKDDVIVPISLTYLEAKFTSSIYWTIFDHVKGQLRDKFSRFFGRVFELYVRRAVQRAIPDHPALARRVYPDFVYATKHGDRKTSDVVVIYDYTAIFLEATASRIRMEATALSGDLTAFDKDLRKIILDNAKQLTDRIRDFRNGLYTFAGIKSQDIKTIYPIIVTIQTVPEATPVWNYIRDLLKQENLLQDPGVQPLQLTDVEELEILESILPEGASFLEILRQRAADPERRNIGIKNFLIAKYPDKGADKGNKYLHAEFLEIGEYAKNLLFQGRGGAKGSGNL